MESPGAGLAVWDHVGDLLLEAGAKPQISFNTLELCRHPGHLYTCGGGPSFAKLPNVYI